MLIFFILLESFEMYWDIFSTVLYEKWTPGLYVKLNQKRVATQVKQKYNDVTLRTTQLGRKAISAHPPV